MAAAVKCGMKAILILDEERPDYCSGNLILDELMGADLYFTTADPKQKAREVMAEYLKNGAKRFTKLRRAAARKLARWATSS